MLCWSMATRPGVKSANKMRKAGPDEQRPVEWIFAGSLATLEVKDAANHAMNENQSLAGFLLVRWKPYRRLEYLRKPRADRRFSCSSFSRGLSPCASPGLALPIPVGLRPQHPRPWTRTRLWPAASNQIPSIRVTRPHLEFSFEELFMNTPETVKTLPPTWRFRLLPFPRYYDVRSGSLYGFYNDRWSLERQHSGGFRVNNYDTSYTLPLPDDAILGWNDDGTTRADGMPFGTIHLRYQIHLFRDCGELIRLSDSDARLLPTEQLKSPELFFDFSPQSEPRRAWLRQFNAMASHWASFYPAQHAA